MSTLRNSAHVFAYTWVHMYRRTGSPSRSRTATMRAPPVTHRSCASGWPWSADHRVRRSASTCRAIGTAPYLLLVALLAGYVACGGVSWLHRQPPRQVNHRCVAGRRGGGDAADYTSAAGDLPDWVGLESSSPDTCVPGTNSTDRATRWHIRSNSRNEAAGSSATPQPAVSATRRQLVMSRNRRWSMSR